MTGDDGTEEDGLGFASRCRGGGTKMGMLRMIWAFVSAFFTNRTELDGD